MSIYRYIQNSKQTFFLLLTVLSIYDVKLAEAASRLLRIELLGGPDE